MVPPQFAVVEAVSRLEAAIVVNKQYAIAKGLSSILVFGRLA
jgi:hypothetical protein